MSGIEMNKMSKREFLRLGLVSTGAVILGACQPKVVEKIVEQTVVVEKPVEKVIKETVIVAGTPQVVEKVVTAAAAPKEPVTLVFWSRGSYSQDLANAYEVFSEENPGIKIEPNEVVAEGGWAAYFDALAVLLAGGEPVDVSYLPTQGMALAAARGFITPIDDLMDVTPLTEYSNDVSPKLVSVAEFGGKTYGLPYVFNNLMIWMNTKRLQEEGLDMPSEKWTWAEFREYARALTRKEGDQTTHFGTTINTDPYWVDGWIFNKGMSGPMGGDAWEEPMVTDPRYIETIQYFHDLIHEDGSAPRPDAVATAQFETGTIGMYWCGHWVLDGYLDQGFEDFEVAYVPQDTDWATVVGCGFWPIHTACAHKQEAWELVSWMLNPDRIVKYNLLGPSTPVHRSIGYSEDFVKWPKNTGERWYESIDRDDIKVRSVTSPPDYSEMDTILQRHLKTILIGETEVESGLQSAQKELEEMVARRPAYWAEIFETKS